VPNWVLFVVVAGVVAVFTAGFVVTRQRGQRPPVEPPAPTPRVPSAPPRAEPIEPVTEPGAVTEPEAQPVEPEAQPVEPEPEAQPVEPEPEPEAQPVEPEPEAQPVVRPRFRDRLSRARTMLAGYVGGILGRSAITDDTWEELEEALLRADVGVATTTALLADLRGRVKAEQIAGPEQLLDALKADLVGRLSGADTSLSFEAGQPNVWLFVGVNGVGKTTTIGKVAKRERAAGRSVLMAAGDTFRAAAAEQLTTWAERSGVEIVRSAEGGDPAAVIFDAIERAAARGIDIVLADTAGRLQTKTNLMEELKKIRRVADKGAGRVTEVLLVLDATTGQNGLSQAVQFREAAMLTGVVLTKLDGTAKGGIAVAIQTELGIPVKLVGLGEGIDDLVPFDAEEYVDALFGS
jgi:fused signal recognition particle receptor